MAVFTIPVIFDLSEKPTGDDVVQIKVTGRQWFWEYEYTDDEFFTANEMHIPVGRPISMEITAPADGVIHSFWVPELNGKKDAVPGRNEFLKFEADKPGTYLGQCAEYCGLSHADMRLRVIAQTEADYDAWVAAAEAAARRRAGRAFVDETLERQVGLHRVSLARTASRASTRRPGRTSRTSATARTFAGGIYETNAREPHEWVHNAPSMKPFGDLQEHGACRTSRRRA